MTTAKEDIESFIQWNVDNLANLQKEWQYFKENESEMGECPDRPMVQHMRDNRDFYEDFLARIAARKSH